MQRAAGGAQEEDKRLRGVFHLRGDGDKAWVLGELELHLEHRTGDYDGGASLEACGCGIAPPPPPPPRAPQRSPPKIPACILASEYSLGKTARVSCWVAI